ncbi:MAG: hypothetical protein PHD43_07145 [Methylococcales bacterium]|nr:hypothetical protein [Methylococcales bacterium]
MAYRRAGEEFSINWEQDDFWRNISGNFIDIAILDWCKLFADPKGKHYWSKVVPNKEIFLESLYIELGITEEEFSAHINTMKHYRDKFLGHLDEELVMHIPKMEISIKSAILLFGVLRGAFSRNLGDAPENLQDFYNERFLHAKTKYPKIT